MKRNEGHEQAPAARRPPPIGALLLGALLGLSAEGSDTDCTGSPAASRSSLAEVAACVPKAAALAQEEEARTLSQVAALPLRDLKALLGKPAATEFPAEMHPWRSFHGSDPGKPKARKFAFVVTGIRKVPPSIPAELPTAYTSASLLTNDNTNAYSRFGLILAIQPENVIATWPTDGQSSRQDPWAYRHTQGVFSPTELANRSGWLPSGSGGYMHVEIYNEVLLDNGKSSGHAKSKVKIVGLYVLESSPAREKTAEKAAIDNGWEGPLLTREERKQIDRLAADSGLPLVVLKKNNRRSLLLRED